MKAPDTIIIVAIVMIMVCVLTWIIPAGEFERTISSGREIVVAGSYHEVASSPQGPFELLMAPGKGFVASAHIISFVLIIGGAFGIINKTRAIEVGLTNVIAFSMKRRAYKKLIIPFLMILFSLAGATFGLSEEVLLFIMITIPFSIALGYDTIVGVSIPFIAAGVGFAGAVTNPFTVGIAQSIAEVPPFSGWGYRIIVWVVLTATAIIYVVRYANRIEVVKNQESEVAGVGVVEQFSRRQAIVIILFFIALVLLIIGSVRWNWYINEITALFLGLSVVSAFVYRLNANEAVAAFNQGAKEMFASAFVIGMAKGILILATEGNIIDTMLFSLAKTLDGFPPIASAEIMFVVQKIINFFVPSGSGQAALTMPIMAPLSDLLGVTRQTSVLIFQLGDGIGNMIMPTSGVTMAVLAAAKMPYVKWVRWVWPLIIWLLILSMLLIIPPVIMQWQ